MKQKLIPILLPTEDIHASICRYYPNGKLAYKSTDLAPHINQHLYLTSESEIKEGDWCYVTLKPSICQYKQGMGKEWLRKIEACTNVELSLPSISQESLEYFVQHQPAEVWIEMELDICKCHNTLGYGNYGGLKCEKCHKNKSESARSADYTPVVNASNEVSFIQVIVRQFTEEDMYWSYLKGMQSKSLPSEEEFRDWLSYTYPIK